MLGHVLFPLPGKTADNLVMADQALAAMEYGSQTTQAYVELITYVNNGVGPLERPPTLPVPHQLANFVVVLVIKPLTLFGLRVVAVKIGRTD